MPQALRRRSGQAQYKYPMTPLASPYSPSLTGRLAANGHPTVGASLWQCEKGRRSC
ncbi:hypothetical protein [Nostoc sp.]|uniref:hypothetical protein n=1 Tax=Nostoc sp. TaxID=1180 RepID=UPI003006C685